MDVNSGMLKLISSEDHEFIVSSEIAKGSGTIKSMLESHFTESKGEIRFPEISSAVLEKVIQYLVYKYQASNSNNKKISNFDIPAELALELLRASDYLDC